MMFESFELGRYLMHMGDEWGVARHDEIWLLWKSLEQYSCFWVVVIAGVVMKLSEARSKKCGVLGGRCGKHLWLAEHFGVMNVTTLIYLKEGKEIARQNLVRRREERLRRC